MKKITINSLMAMKYKKEKIACLTAYDATFSRIASQEVDVILVGDSLGNVIQGEQSTIPVTIEHMCYHTLCVSKGIQQSLLIADLPFATYHTPDTAIKNATSLMQAGAEMVKIEGGAWLNSTIVKLKQNGIPTCGHLGLTPQSVNIFGGYKVQGKSKEQADYLYHTALELENAGLALLVLECIPSDLASKITQSLTIPVIGIGAGEKTDGQVLVSYDMLNLTDQSKVKFVKNFMQHAHSIQEAIALYVNEVKTGAFPSTQYSF